MLMIKIVYCIILYYRPLCKSHQHRKRSHLQGVQKWHQEVPIFWSPLVGFADKNLQQSRIANPVWSCWMWPMMRMCYMTISCFTLCNLCVLVPLIVALHSTLSLSLSRSLSVCPTRATSLELYHSRHLNDISDIWSATTFSITLKN